MALLSEEKRIEYFKELGLGEYNETNILKMQKKYMYRKTDWDSVYGTDCDNLLRHLKAVKDNCTDFAPEEFHCGCNGKYCCGYPTWMKPVELKNIQKIRTHFGKPMAVTCGLRCTHYNQEVGGIARSEHLFGLATDYYIQGVTDTLANRKQSIKWISKLPNHSYTYGDGIYVSTSNGSTKTGHVSAPGMGNAMHTDSKEGITPKPTPSGKLVVDGIGGVATVQRMQEFFDTSVQDGVISGQNLSLQKKYYPSLTSVKGGSGGSPCIKKLQLWVGTTQDGVLGENTVRALQKKIGVTASGILDKASMKAWQKYLNEHPKPVYPPAPKKYKVIDISEFQDEINWKKAKADGVQGAIIRCGLRGAGSGKLSMDSMFLNHIKGAHKEGVPVGIYMFTEAINAKEGSEEADYAIKMWETAGVPIYFPIAVDTENVFYNENGKKIAGRANDTKLSKAKRTEAIKAFCERIKEKGYTPMIYASTSWLHNQLDMSKLPYDVWVAQYNDVCQYEGKYVIWQYTSEGRVAGAEGNIDLNHCYIDPKKVDPKVDPPKPAPAPAKKGYTGPFPTITIKKTTAQVIADAIEWAKWIARDNSFHYGHGKAAHRAGCFFCGTEQLKKGKGIKDWERTWVCNTFVTSAFAHGGCVPSILAIDQNRNCFDWNEIKSMKEFKKVSGTPKPGDVLCSDRHMALSLGGNKVVQAAHEDDNVKNSKSWNSSISEGSWSGYNAVYRFTGSVNKKLPMYVGEVSDRVKHLKDFLRWYGFNLDSNRLFSENTERAVKIFQEQQKLVVDGIVGENTIKAMKAVKK